MRKICVGYVFGGDSPEHEISIITAIQIAKGIRGMVSQENIFLYLDKTNRNFYLINIDDMKGDNFKGNQVKSIGKLVTICYGGIIKTTGLIKRKIKTVDAIINCCHGGFGESGELSGYFKKLNIPISTYSHTALGLSMDKNLFKCLMRGVGINVPNWVTLTRNQIEENPEEIIRISRELKYPLIVKPNSSGSSLGVTSVKNEEELFNALNVAFEFDNKVIVERMINNKIEFNCAVIGTNLNFVVSDVDQIQESGDVFTFSEKYIGASSEKQNIATKNDCCDKMGKVGMQSAKRLLPAPISEELTLKIKKTTGIIFKTLGLSGVCRVDFLYDKKKKKLYANEVNAVPGSMALYFFKNSCLSTVDVVTKLKDVAIQEAKMKKHIDEKYIPKIFN